MQLTRVTWSMNMNVQPMSLVWTHGARRVMGPQSAHMGMMSGRMTAMEPLGLICWLTGSA